MTEDNLNNSTLDQFVSGSDKESSDDSSSSTPNDTPNSTTDNPSTSSTDSEKNRTTQTETTPIDSKDSYNPKLQTDSPIVTKCLHDMSGVRVKKSSAESYASNLRLFVNWLQEKEIESVKITDVWTYLKHRVSNGKAKTTVTGDLTAIKNLYGWIFLETEKSIEIDYLELEAINISKLQFPDPISREPLEEEELELLYEHMNCFRDRLMATVAAETGARNSDVRRITLSRLNLKDEDPQIELTNTKEGGTYPAYISKFLATEIEYYIDQRRPAYPSYEDSDYLFLSNTGEKLTTRQFNSNIKDAAERAGIQSVIGTRVQRQGDENVEQNVHRVTPHALRHTFNNMLEKENVPAEHRAKALDQDSIEVNREYYSHEDIDYAKFVKRLHGN